MTILPARRIAAAALLALGVGIAGAAHSQNSAQGEPAKIGEPVKDFQLQDLWTGKDVKLSQHHGKTVVLSFVSYNCAVSWRYETRMGKLVSKYEPKKVVFLTVRSNARDTVDGIKKYCETKNLTMPLLYDQKNTLSDYLGARVTPTFYVIDAKGVLRYGGACDDNADETAVGKSYLVDAIDAVLAGKDVPVKTSRAFG